MAQKKITPSEAAMRKFEEGFAKHFGDGVLRRTDRIDRYPIISTGSLALDVATGVGGYVQGRIHEYWGPESTGKGLPVDTPVLTPTGWRSIGDLAEGDEVVGADGLPTAVVGIYDRGVLPVYRVTFTDKSSVLCDADHLWQVRSKKHRARGTHAVLAVSDLQNRKLLNADGSGRYEIPMVQPVWHEKADLSIAPYLMGVVLANAGLTSKAVITTNDEAVIARVREESPHLEVREHAPASARRWYIPGLMALLRTWGLMGKKSATKFIPREYLHASVDQRLALLQGLMDCDGTVSGSVRYSTTSPDLASGVLELAQSLGGNASISKLQREGVWHHSVAVHLPSHLLPVSTPRKVEHHGRFRRREPVRKIRSIIPEGVAEVRCIRVAAEDELFVTANHLVTHNSTQCLNAVREAQKLFPEKMVGYIDMEQSLDAKWAKEHGVDLKKMYHYQPDNAEDVADAAEQMMMAESGRGKGLISVVIIDSVGGMISEAEWAKTATEDTVAEQARIVTRMVKKAAVTARRLGTTVIIVNQVRSNISKYGGDTTTGGGWALKHASTMKFKTRKVDSITEVIDGESQEVALKIAVMVEKNKVAPARRSAELIIANQPSKISPTIGLVRTSDIVTLGKRFGLFDGAGSWLILPGHEKPGLNGQAAVEQYLREHEDEADVLWAQVVERAANPFKVEAGAEA